MKRHPVMAHLSRDHHPALIMAQLLKRNAAPYKGMPTDLPGKMNYAIEFYQSHLVSHFKEEEQMMLLVENLHNTLDEKITEIRSEHIFLHRLFTTLPSAPDKEAALHQLGTSLDNHIRKEERELFPLIETYAGDEKMSAIEVLLAR